MAARTRGGVDGKSECKYDVVRPRGQRQIGLMNVAPRLESLAGKKVAQLWDYGSIIGFMSLGTLGPYPRFSPGLAGLSRW
jgi:hypothetical protein